MSHEIMIDIETISTNANASILSIAALRFNSKDRAMSIESYPTFYRKINKESCDAIGLHVDSTTLEWWAKQDDKVRTEAFDDPVDRVDLKEALQSLSDFISDVSGKTIIWANSPDFDCTILTSAYKALGLQIPWKYWNTRDLRTAYHLANINPWSLPKTEKHHPISDCHNQIIGLSKVSQKLSVNTFYEEPLINPPLNQPPLLKRSNTIKPKQFSFPEDLDDSAFFKLPNPVEQNVRKRRPSLLMSRGASPPIIITTTTTTPTLLMRSNNEKVTTTTNPTTTEEQSTDHSSIRTVENTNGMSHCIYGQSHWTDEDYRDELRSLNQSLRDF